MAKRRMANAAACSMADGEMTPLSRSLPLYPPPLGEGRAACPFCCLLCCCFSRCFSLLLLWLPTRRRHVWLPLDFRHDFLFAHSPSPLPLPHPVCHFHMQSACCPHFFVAFFVGHFLCSLAKSQPMSCGIFK